MSDRRFFSRKKLRGKWKRVLLETQSPNFVEDTRGFFIWFVDSAASAGMSCCQRCTVDRCIGKKSRESCVLCVFVK